MKRINKNLFLMMLVIFLPLTIAFGQEKKNEQKIKVLIDEGSGTKIVLDTTFSGGSLPEKVTLKNGNVIFIGNSETGRTQITTVDGEGKISVTVTTDNDEVKKEEKKVILISSDSLKWTVESPEKGKHIYVYTDSKGSDGKSVSHVKIKSVEDKVIDLKGDKVIIIRDGEVTEDEEGKTFNIRLESDDNDTDTEMTRYVVAKDGIIVTVESNDEVKAKEVINAIESKLDVKTDEKGKNVGVVTETKKAVKK